MKQLVVIGAGESGLGAALLAKQKGYGVFVSDRGTITPERKARLVQEGIEFEEQQHSDELILRADLIIKSPGIPSTAPIIQMALDQGIQIVDELEFAFSYTQGKIIAITGTNGKTTTTLLTYHLLKNAGLDVGLAGNVGPSWAGQLLQGDRDWWVLEVSSFQLDGMDEFHPYIALLTTITPDHLDRYHGQMDRYIASKFRIFARQTSADFALLRSDDHFTGLGLESFSLASQVIKISQKKECENYLDGDYLQVGAGKQRLRLQVDKLPISGVHNQLNVLFAVKTAQLAGIDNHLIETGLLSFINAPHRMEPIACENGLLFINDSKATNVESAAYALGSFPSGVIWIAGGVDKGNDYSQLQELVRGRVHTLICLGRDNAALLAAFEGIIPDIRETRSMREAVNWARNSEQDGEVVLLSPACASFDLFANYEDRGEQFRRSVIDNQTERIA